MQHDTAEPNFAAVNGLRLAHDRFGNPHDPALLLIMGLGTQMIAWDEAFCTQLAGRGFHVIRFDNRDIGLSTHLSDAGVPDIGRLLGQAMLGMPVSAGSVPYTLADMADDSVGLLDTLGVRTAHVVGASMGGAIAQEITLRYPERVRSMVSIMSASGAPGLPGPTPQAMQLLTSPSPTDRAGYVARHEQVMRVLRGGADAAEEALDAGRAQRAFDRGLNPAGFVRQFAAILASGSRRERLPSVKTPTLVIHGDADPLVPFACGEDLARHIPGARLLTVPGMGHALPRTVWPEIIGAIDTHAKAAERTA